MALLNDAVKTEICSQIAWKVFHFFEALSTKFPFKYMKVTQNTILLDLTCLDLINLRAYVL